MGGSAIVEIIFGLPGIGNTLINAIFNRDYPVVQAATMMLAVRLHLREPHRRPPLRRPRPEDLAGMSQGDFEAPVLAPEGPSEVGAEPVGLRPDAPRSALREVEEPDRDRRRDHRRAQRLHRALRQVPLDDRPGRARRDPAPGPELGAPDGHRRARARHPRPDHPRRPGLAAGGAHLGQHRARPRALDRADLRLLRRQGRHAADAVRRPHVRAAGARARDRDRRSARAEPPERDDRDRDHHHAGLRAGRARRGARGDGLPVRRVGAGARLVALRASWRAT